MQLRYRILVALCFLLLPPTLAHAWTEESLKINDPFSFTPNDLSLRSFKLEGPVLWEWVPNSFEWTRVGKRFLIPRAKVRLTVPVTARVTYQKQVYIPNAEGKVEVAVVLSQERTGAAGRNEIFVEDFATKQMSRAEIVFKSQGLESPVSFDANCSPYRLDKMLSDVQLSRSWIYVYCRPVHPSGENGYDLKLDLDIYWEMEGSPETAQVNGRPVVFEDAVTTSVVLDARTPKLSFRRGPGEGDHFDLEAHLPERFHPLGVSLGIGPYSHQNVLRAFTTVYASWFFNEQLKVAMFGAFPVRQSPEIDVGLYLVAEQARFIDDRILVNLLLGFHTLSYVPNGQRVSASSAPQGIEIIFRDCFFKRQNLMVGGFFYPDIKDRFYVNTWLRYGGSIFAEINFINWQEPVASGGTFSAKSFGLSIGFPLFRAF